LGLALSGRIRGTSSRVSASGQAPAAELAEVALDDATVPRSELWADRGVVAGVTMRGSGFNLGLATDEPAVAVLERWRGLGRVMQPRFSSLVTSRQVHGTALAWHDRPAPGLLILDGLDGHLTGTAGVLLTVSVADCVPVYLLVPRTGTVALVHAGWRGVVAGILPCAVALLRARAGVMARDVVMHCGVAICGACYKVGPEVLAQFPDRGGASPGHVDLRGVLAGQARALGIDEQSRSPWCSAHDPQFFSHRASRGRDGRMLAYAGRPLA
jgi:copper oxidase (laccase) domain-containing protein